MAVTETDCVYVCVKERNKSEKTDRHSPILITKTITTTEAAVPQKEMNGGSFFLIPIFFFIEPSTPLLQS